MSAWTTRLQQRRQWKCWKIRGVSRTGTDRKEPQGRIIQLQVAHAKCRSALKRINMMSLFMSFNVLNWRIFKSCHLGTGLLSKRIEVKPKWHAMNMDKHNCSVPEQQVCKSVLVCSLFMMLSLVNRTFWKLWNETVLQYNRHFGHLGSIS